MNGNSSHRRIARWGICVLLPALITATCIGTPEEFQDTGVIVFLNETQLSITDVRVAICDDTAYGINRMGNLLEVPPGRDFRVRVSPGCWDARLGFDNVFVTRSDITVREDEETTVRLTSLE